jgi:Zn-dependent protease
MELRDLVISLIALIIAFSVLFGGRQLDTDMILISTLGVASGFLLHELAHKFTAMHFGYLAEYRANLMGLGLAVVSAFAGFLIAAPGAVMISRSRPPVQAYIQDGSAVPDPFQQEELASQLKREMLLISLAGPLTNIVLAATFFILGKSGLVSSGLWPDVVGFALFINLILAAFNMLPFGPLDGKKIFDADRRVWALVGLPAILIALPRYLEMV